MPRRTSAGDIENVGPVLLIRRSTKPRASEFQIAGNGILEAAKSALKFDDQKRLYSDHHCRKWSMDMAATTSDRLAALRTGRL